MKIIRKKDLESQKRPDGRLVTYYPPFDIPEKTKQIGFITATTPKNCNEDKTKHPISTEIFYHLTPGQVEINGNIYDLDAGDIVIIEPGDVHKQLAPENDIDIIVLRIPLSTDKVVVK